MVEVGGETTLEEEEEVLLEEDEAEVLQISVVAEKTKIQFNQVTRGLINQNFNVIIVRNLVIMHMNAERSNMTKEKKPQPVDEHQHFVEHNVDVMYIPN